MKTIDQLRLGLSTYKEAHRFIKQHRWYGYFLVPIVLNLLFLALFSYIGTEVYGDIYGWLGDAFGLWNNSAWPRLQVLLALILAVVVGILILMIYLVVFKYIILILLSPLLAYLSERAEEKLTGRSFPFSAKLLIKDIMRGIRIAFKNGVKEVGFSILFLIAHFIPVLGFLAPVAVFLTESYFYGFSMLDYTNERHRLPPAESQSLIKRYKYVAIANGAVFNLLLLSVSVIMFFFPLLVGLLLRFFIVIPVIVLSVAPIYSVIAGTIAAIRIQEIEKNNPIWTPGIKERFT